MQAFDVDERLARDSDAVLDLGVCQLRLMNDSRWPWLILVPRREGAVELFDLPEADQRAISAETARVGSWLKAHAGAAKINIGALGNIVRQLHIHVVARSEGDAAWPGPVWGHGRAQPYEAAEKDQFIRAIREALAP